MAEIDSLIRIELTTLEFKVIKHALEFAREGGFSEYMNEPEYFLALLQQIETHEIGEAIQCRSKI